MAFNDSLSDMLARIKNAHQAKKVSTLCLKSKLNINVLSVLKEEGYIRDFNNIEEKKGINSIKILNICIFLNKHAENKQQIQSMCGIHYDFIEVQQFQGRCTECFEVCQTIQIIMQL